VWSVFAAARGAPCLTCRMRGRISLPMPFAARRHSAAGPPRLRRLPPCRNKDKKKIYTLAAAPRALCTKRKGDKAPRACVPHAHQAAASTKMVKPCACEPCSRQGFLRRAVVHVPRASATAVLPSVGHRRTVCCGGIGLSPCGQPGRAILPILLCLDVRTPRLRHAQRQGHRQPALEIQPAKAGETAGSDRADHTGPVGRPLHAATSGA
jgi:hypothetical protein